MDILGSQRFIKGPTALRLLRRGGGAAPAGPDYNSAAIGDEIGGGIYAGINTIATVDYHIIVGKSDSDVYGLQWRINTLSTPGTGSTTDGLANTNAIIADNIDAHPAAKHCVNHAGGGFTDWHMPAQSQMVLIYNNLRTHPELATNVGGQFPALTWESMSQGAGGAYVYRLADGARTSVLKTDTARRTRPVRRVPV